MLNLIICQEKDIASARYDAIAAQSADAQLLQGQYDELLQRYTLLTQVSTVGDTKKVNVCICMGTNNNYIYLKDRYLDNLIFLNSLTCYIFSIYYIVYNSFNFQKEIEEVEKDRAIMQDSKNDAERDIKQWEEEFKQREGM